MLYKKLIQISQKILDNCIAYLTEGGKCGKVLLIMK